MTDEGGQFGPTETVPSGFGYELTPGDLVTVTDGVSEKDHIVTNVVVTGIDVATDEVFGTSDPDVSLWVWIHESAVSLPATADTNGDWSVDFSSDYDLVPGTGGGVAESDDDGDQTQIDWRVPDPQFRVDPVGDQVWGGDWLPNGMAYVSAYAGACPGAMVDLIGEVMVPTDGEGGFHADLAGASLDVEAGDCIAVTDTATLKDHTVRLLTVTEVDVDGDVVLGTAALGSSVWANIHESGFDDVEAVAGVDLGSGVGGWDVWFDGLIEEDTEGYVYQPDDDGDATELQWPSPPPEQSFNAYVDQQAVDGYQWDIGVTVALTASHWSGTDWVPHFTDTEVSALAPWDPEQTFVSFVVPGLVAGDLLVMSGDGIIKDHVVRAVSFAVDRDADIVSGTGSPDADINVWVNTENVGSQRHVIADGVGDFVADFSVEGDEDFEQDTHAFTNATSGQVAEADDDNDASVYDFYQIPTPDFTVHRDSGDVWGGGGWLPMSPITVTLGDPLAPIDSFVAMTDAGGQFGPTETVPSGFGYELMPGDLVTVTDGVSEKDHFVTDVVVTDVDVLNDTVTGTAQPDVSLWVWVHETAVSLPATADTNGDWSVDFSADYDLVPGTGGGVAEADDDNDQTQIDWRVPDPQFRVDPVNDQVWGDDWVADGSATVSVYESDGATLKGTLAAGIDADGNFHADFNSVPVDVMAGDIVTVDDTVTLKDHTVRLLTVTDVDVDGDVVLGTAALGSSVWANIHESGFDDVEAVAGVDLGSGVGGWDVWFDGLIEEDTEGYVYQPDDDGDQTQIQWPMSGDAVPPTVGVSAPTNWSMVSAVVLVEGSATDDVGVSSVVLEIFDRDTGDWWNGSVWQEGRTSVLATLDAAGALSTGWSYPFDPPVVASQPYWVTVRSFDAAGNASPYVYVNFGVVSGDAMPPRWVCRLLRIGRWCRLRCWLRVRRRMMLVCRRWCWRSSIGIRVIGGTGRCGRRGVRRCWRRWMLRVRCRRVGRIRSIRRLWRRSRIG